MNDSHHVAKKKRRATSDVLWPQNDDDRRWRGGHVALSTNALTLFGGNFKHFEDHGAAAARSSDARMLVDMSLILMNASIASNISSVNIIWGSFIA